MKRKCAKYYNKTESKFTSKCAKYYCTFVLYILQKASLLTIWTSRE